MRHYFPALFFSKKEKQRIQNAIQGVEKETSAEIRVHLERPRKGQEILDQAREAFERIGMTSTKDRNGILIFLCPETRRFAVLGDQGIHAKVSPRFWEEITHSMELHFRKDCFADGICGAIESIGEKIKKYFPREGSDQNELPDRVSYS